MIGGGNGSALVLVALKKYIRQYDLSAVISMTDSGGSSGRLRRELGTLPPGDIMRAVLALSPYDYLTLRAIFYSPRFSGCGRLNTHNFGNLFLTLCTRYGGDFLAALKALSQSVSAMGEVLPVTMDSAELVAELENGETVRTEEFIDNPSYNLGWKIKKVWLDPKVKAYAPVLQKIKEADVIILSPGSLYTSIVASLLPIGVKNAINKSKAKIIYIAGNSYRSTGETGPEQLSQFVSQVENYLPRRIDKVLFNTHIPSGSEKKYYREKRWSLIKLDIHNLEAKMVMKMDLEKRGGGMCDIKLGKALRKAIK